MKICIRSDNRWYLINFIENKYDELSVKISDPSIMANQKEWRKLCKEHADLEVIVNKYKEYKEATEELEANKEMLSEESDQEMREMINSEMQLIFSECTLNTLKRIDGKLN